MTRAHRLGLAVAATLGGLGLAADTDLANHLLPQKAVAAKIVKGAPTPTATVAKPGFLGVHVTGDGGKLVVAAVAADSPAAKAGVRAGDALVTLDGATVADESAFHDALRGKAAGDAVKLGLGRDGQPLTLKVALDPLTKPVPPARPKAILGIQVAQVTGRDGLVIEEVSAETPADRAKIKPGEVLLKIDDVGLSAVEKFNDLLAAKKPDDTVTLTLLLAEKTVEMKVKLAAERLAGERSGPGRFGGNRPGGEGASRAVEFTSRYWSKPTFRLGIIGVEYPDVKHNDKVTPKAWEEAMFTEGLYTKASVSGNRVHGSLRDYFVEQSFGGLKVEGRAFDYVQVSKKRAEYSEGSKNVFLTEAMEKLVAREGADALKDLDGVFFIYAGSNFQVPRGSLYWPHRSSVSFGGRRWPYFICPEGSARQGKFTMGNISVFCHEFGHMLGLPDLYAQPENPGMEGSGVWSAMANQTGDGKPQHFCAWSKEKLGWVKPTVIDPTVKQKLVLPPVEDAPENCFKVLVRPDASEYLLLENRRKKGFDASLPAEGLLIWRVVGGRPFLQESHGIEGAAGPRVFLDKVPYPSIANDAYTPYTVPSSRSATPGATPVYITNIRRVGDAIAFHIGYEYH